MMLYLNTFKNALRFYEVELLYNCPIEGGDFVYLNDLFHLKLGKEFKNKIELEDVPHHFYLGAYNTKYEILLESGHFAEGLINAGDKLYFAFLIKECVQGSLNQIVEKILEEKNCIIQIYDNTPAVGVPLISVQATPIKT